MNPILRLRKTLAWVLIVTLANPFGAFSPAFARDTDIFLATAYSSTTAEPNVLVVLDTSDSMNIPEPWREYAGAYDSHVEYLWNDIGVIGNSETASENLNRISTSVPPTAPISVWGTWAGATLADRRALWTAARDYANATEPGDPGPRREWRNYADANWLWWLPAGTAETDLRLSSMSLNRFAGGTRVVGGTRGGINFGSTSDVSSFNQCGTSISQLTPSTVFAPSSQPRNAGHFRNQQWQRWERFLALDNSRVAAYPLTAPTMTGGRTIASGSGTGNVNASNVATATDYAFTPGLTIPTVVRDNTGASLNFGNNAQPGSQGHPVRTRIDGGTFNAVDAGDSRAGWSNLRADAGGYTYVSLVNSWTDTQRQQVLQQLYGVTQTSAEARWRLYKGRNTDVADGSLNFGTPAYYNTPAIPGSMTSGSNTLTLDAHNHQFLTGNIVVVPRAGTAGAPLVGQVTAVGGTGNRTVTLSVAAATSTGGPVPVTRHIRFNAGTAASCTRTCNNSVAATAASPSTDATGASFSWRPNSSTCVDGGTSGSGCGSVTPAACGGPTNNNNYTTVAYSGCSWSGRTAVPVEGVGTYFVGGQCTGNCTSRFPDACPASGTPAGSNFCNNTATASQTINGVLRTNVTLNTGGNGSGSFCSNRGNVSRSCSARPDPSGGSTCSYGRTCNNVTALASVSTTDLAVFNLVATDTHLVHECRADNGTAANPSSGSMTNATNRTFATAWAATSSTTGTTAPYTPSNPGASYPAVDVYSTNYLNWKYGPKGPNGHPIGRKTRLQIAKDALTDLVSTTDGVRFGLMVFNRTRTDLTNDGANVAYAMRRMGSNTTDPDTANRTTLNNAILSTTAAARTPLTESLYEAYLYFAGRTPQWGTDTTTALVGGTAVSTGRDTSAVCTAVGPGCPSIGVYRSPMLNNPNTTTPAGCQKNFVILLTDGGPEHDFSANTIAGGRGVRNMTWVGTPGGVVSPRTGPDETNANTTTDQFEVSASTPFGPTDLAGTSVDGGYVWLDELAYFMSRADISPGAQNFTGETSTDLLQGRQSAITYTIGFAGANSPVLQNAAQKSGGQFYIAEDSEQLAAALLNALVSIRDWNPTVSAPTVPISALSRTQNSTDVYLAFFRPTTTQRWNGTVKKFMLGDPVETPGICGTGITDLCLIGQTVLEAPNNKNIEKVEIDSITSLETVAVNPDASSFWGPSTLRDGGTPDNGGTGYQLMNTPGYNPSTRRIYTRLSTATSVDLTNSGNAVSEGNTAITKARLGNASMSDAQRSTLLNWARGGNTGDAACSDASAGTACTAWRSWAHGDVQHSRPALVTYNPSTSPPSQFMFYASSTGYLHAVDSNTGAEKWTFLIEEALPQLAALMANGAGAQIYIADGSPVVQVNDANQNGIVDGTDSVWLFFGLRRGGRAYYALDITNIDAPRFMWKITPTQICTAAGCSASTAYAELGQSWSTPTVGRVRAIADPVLLFGGGYDPNQDNRPVAAADTMGRAVFVTNARTGALEASFTSANARVTGGSMSFSIPSDLTAIDTDLEGNGYLDRIYVGDMGGRVWRFDIGDPDKSLWGGRLLATLAVTSPTDRRIFFPPAAVKQLRRGVRYDAVIVGTGNRENPLKDTSSDVIAMIKDPDYGLYATSTTVISMSAGDLLNLGSTSGGTTETALIDNPSVKGWYRPLDTGEKVINAPTVFFERIRFGTYTPIAQSNACVPPGQGRINELDLLGAYTIPVTAGMSRFFPGFVTRSYSSTGQLLVLPGSTAAGRRVFFISAADSRLFGRQQVILGAGTRVYWYTDPQN